MKDLFGYEAKPRGKHYVRPAGYVMPPGSGPDEKTCKDCKHLCRIRFANTYLKCGLARSAWTGGRKSDILANSPTCSKFEEGEHLQEDIQGA